MVTPATLIITMDDCRKAGFCVMGVRRWFIGNGFDFRDFLANGIPAEAMLATGDGQGRQAVARTVQRRILPALSLTEDEALTLLEQGIEAHG